MKHQAAFIYLHFKLVNLMISRDIFSTLIYWVFWKESYLKWQSSQTEVSYELLDKFWPWTDETAELIDDFLGWTDILKTWHELM